ncbi:MAG: hypothetical protein M3Y87_12010 [Myxococcota bacterium]|nr:hypothetical protein [Myxococcota bacterium]
MTKHIRVYALASQRGTEFVNAGSDAADLALVSDTKSRIEGWSPVPMKLERARSRSDFLGIGTIIVRNRVAERWRDVIGAYAEFLPLDLNGERIWFINVTHTVDALDPERTSPLHYHPDRPGEVMFMGPPAFRPEQLDGAPIFKLTNDPNGSEYLSEEFVRVNESWDFDGFEARVIWDSVEGPVLRGPRAPQPAAVEGRRAARKGEEEARPRGPLRLKAPPATVLGDTRDFAIAGRGRLRLSGAERPQDVLRAAVTYLRRETENGANPLADLYVLPEIGSAIGDAIGQALGWSWMELVVGKARNGKRVVASPDGSYAVDPYALVQRTAVETGEASAMMLLFNLLVAGELPPKIDGEVQLLG